MITHSYSYFILLFYYIFTCEFSNFISFTLIQHVKEVLNNIKMQNESSQHTAEYSLSQVANFFNFKYKIKCDKKIGKGGK